MGFLVSHQKSWIRIAGMKKKKKRKKKELLENGEQESILKKKFPWCFFCN